MYVSKLLASASGRTQRARPQRIRASSPEAVGESYYVRRTTAQHVQDKGGVGPFLGPDGDGGASRRVRGRVHRLLAAPTATWAPPSSVVPSLPPAPRLSPRWPLRTHARARRRRAAAGSVREPRPRPRPPPSDETRPGQVDDAVPSRAGRALLHTVPRCPSPRMELTTKEGSTTYIF